MTITLNEGNQAKSLVIARKAVFEEGGKQYVYRLDGDTVGRVEVELGVKNNELAEVKSGLSLDDQVVVKGQSLLSDGAHVQIQNILEKK